MRLHHIDMRVSSVPAARTFFETHFGFRCVYQRRGEIALMEDDAGLSFGLSNLSGSPPPVYPPDFHIGFILTGESEVRAVHDRLTAAGVAIKTGLAKGGPNIYFMCVGPDGIVIEVRAPLDK